MENNPKVHSCHSMKKVDIIALRIKLLIVLFFVSFTVVHATDKIHRTKINLQLENVTLKVILNAIEKNSDFIFIYNEGVINSNTKRSISVKNESIENVMSSLFKGLDIVFKIDGRQVSISKKDRSEVDQPKIEVKKNKITGVITDENKQTVIGASVMLIGSNFGTVTDINGRFSIEASENSQLKVSYIGYEPKLIEVKGKTFLNISLNQSLKNLDDVVVVGYGSQKKQSVVGAIVQTKGSDLERSGQSTSVAQALTGLLPGVSTFTVSGMPGADATSINIRGLSSWNGSSPLVLIDGVERLLSDIDVGQIESISVLKDASATAVFGVKGAEGVILVTTKRGKEGKAQISFSSNIDMKFVSRIPNRMDSYDTFNYQNAVLEKQNPAYSGNWSWYLPQAILNKYRYPANVLESEEYPNVNWGNEITRPFAMTQKYELNITGGTKFAKYFTSLSYLKDDDMLKSGIDVGLPFKPQFGAEHYNFRTNLDLNLTKTTVLSVNLAGSLSQSSGYNDGNLWIAFYRLSPSIFPVRFSDGAFGISSTNPSQENPIATLTGGGTGSTATNYTTQIFSDFKLKQSLEFITKGLTAEGSLTYDNRMYSTKSITGVSLQSESIGRDGTIVYVPARGANNYDFYMNPGNISPETFNTGSTVRRLHYQGQVNYAQSFDKHDFSALVLVSRDELTTGSEFPHYAEDWVGRFTYGYDDRYFFETNGAYNGSERFAPKYRFGFFPSVGLGWMLSNEKFLKFNWLDKLKIRYSIGNVGSDNFASERWSYNTQWGLDGNKTTFGTNYTTGNPNTGVGATYAQYKELVIGNPNLQWETSTKQNLGFDYSLLNGLISGTFDVFQDDRSNVFMTADQLSNDVYAYFGAAPVAANVGKVQNKGYEFELKLQKTWSGFHCWLNYSFSHAKEKVIYAAEPILKPEYQKMEGYQIGQPTSLINQPGVTKGWDGIFGSVPFTTNSGRLPGDNAMVDINGDGVINGLDAAHYGYTSRPQNTYNITAGVDYKGFSLMVQLFGVYDANINYSGNLGFSSDALAPQGNAMMNDYWTPSNPNAVYALSRSGGSGYNVTTGNVGYILDASYLRLKNVELGYTFKGDWLKKLNMNTLKISLSGNNLIFWSKLPEDKEAPVDTYNSSGSSLYPTSKVISFRLNATF